MVNIVLLGLLACSSLTHAIPISQGPADVASILTRRAAVDACPGYTASNVVESDSGLTADLTLSGDACNAYSDDIKDLKLLVEYQTGKTQLSHFELDCLLILYRRPPARQDL
jgi:alpha-glucosidase